ncbi:EthD family reductase [Xenophilus sp.]|uniref:EthD family reductase n=1 Tax=Xenophilus sp. TaxID=1873499 RepID=UPI0037DD5A2D
MNVRMGLIRQQPGWSHETFSRYWLEQHGPLAARVPGLAAYWQNVVQERLQRGIDYARGPWDVDGFSQLTLEAAGAKERPFAEGALARRLIDDEQHFLGGLHIVEAEPVEVIRPDPQQRPTLLKRMSILRRRPDLDEAGFRREWRVHADLVRAMPGVAGYRQNVVVARERVKGRPCGYDELPIDGIVELWFESTATLEAAFGSPEGRRTMAHAKTFLAEITAFLVTERRIV